MLAMQQMTNSIHMINAFSAQNIQEINKIALKSQTVLPGQEYGGYFYLNTRTFKEQNNVIITVRVGKEQFPFTFAFDKEGEERDFGVVKDFDKAEKLYQKAKSIRNQKDSEYKDPVQAISYLTESLQYYELPWVYYARSIAYQEIGEMDYAISDMNSVVLLDPDHAMGYYRRGFLYEEVEQFELALKDYAKYISLQPDNPDGYLLRSYVYAKLNMIEQSCSDAVKACVLGEKCQLLGFLGENGHCK